MYRFRCCNCGKLFNHPKEVEESRGEFWGVPCFEKMYYSPCCDDDFEDAEEQTEYFEDLEVEE